MSSGHSFDELGRIIASGGIRSAAFGLLKVGGGINLVNWLTHRFPALSRAQAGSLATMARSFHAAGTLLETLAPMDRIDPNAVPVIPGGAGPSNASFRYWSDVRLTYVNPITGKPTIVTIGLGSDEPPAIEELTAQSDYVMQSDEWSRQHPNSPKPGFGEILVDVYIGGILRQW